MKTCFLFEYFPGSNEPITNYIRKTSYEYFVENQILRASYALN